MVDYQEQINALQSQVSKHEERFDSYQKELYRQGEMTDKLHERLDTISSNMLKKTDFEEVRENLVNRDAVAIAKRLGWIILTVITGGLAGYASKHWGV